MATKNMTDIITALSSLLATVTAIKEVDVTVPDQIKQYPCAILYPENWSEKFETLRITSREYNIRIRIVGNLEGTRASTQTQIRDAVDEVMQVFGKQTNLTLGGKVDWSQLTSGQFLFNADKSAVIGADMTYKCKVSFDRS